MMMIHRRAVFMLMCALLAGSPYLRSADTIPREIDHRTFWRMVTDMSEESGYFRFQFMSNEVEFPSVVPELKKNVKPGGVYLGVGPEQNFTYIAASQPRIAFIFDIRRDNMIEHLIYKTIFETSANRAEFISKLFSRKAAAPVTEKSPVRALFHAYATARPDSQLFNQNLLSIKTALSEFPLDRKDLAEVDEIYSTIVRAGPGSDYSGFAGGFRGGMSGYAALMTATDDQGQAWSFLADEENFQFVREMERKNLIIPLVGNFSGPKAIRAVGTYLKEHGAAVTMFYTSNVEQYLFQQDDDWRRYYSNVATLPTDASSIFIRSSHYAFGAASQRSRQFAGMNYVMLLCSIPDLTKAFASGRVRNYDDVIRLSH
jgi:hypothetical protein